MNTGKTLFAQLMDYLPWSTFTRIVTRYDGDHRVRTLSCAEQYRVMAFAQLTYRESLRDIEVCLSAQTAKRHHEDAEGDQQHEEAPAPAAALPGRAHRVRDDRALGRGGPPRDLGGCQRGSRLEDLRRVCTPADRSSQKALRR